MTRSPLKRPRLYGMIILYDPPVPRRWQQFHRYRSGPIVGVCTPEQLEDNLGAIGWESTDEELTHLNEVSAVGEGYPYCMIRAYGAR